MALPANELTLLPAMLLAFGLSSLSCWWVRRYALRNGMLDLPGRRRSHSVPTPRAGGLGFALIGILLLLPLGLELRLPALPLAALLVCALALALVSLADDHRPLSPWPRLLVQVLAALAATAVLGSLLPGGASAWVWLLLAPLAVLWSINLHNFMDGINGLLAVQALWVLLAKAVLAALAAESALVVYALLLAAAVAGFVPWNLPRARLFMGDVGSATLGFLLAVLALLGWRQGAWSLSMLLVLHSAFILDATLTLLFRVLRGRRWYHPHREHLYQWWVRRGASHVSVVARYGSWNLAVCAPVLVLMSLMPELQALLAAVVLTVGALLWRTQRQRLLRRARLAGH